MWIQRSLVEAMMTHAIGVPEHRHYATLFLISYAFLLRVPSEALPMVAARPDSIPDTQSALYLDGESLVLKLKSRKNKRAGSTLVRYCTCKVVLAAWCFSVCVYNVLAGMQTHVRCAHSWEDCLQVASGQADFCQDDGSVCIGSVAKNS